MDYNNQYRIIYIEFLLNPQEIKESMKISGKTIGLSILMWLWSLTIGLSRNTQILRVEISYGAHAIITTPRENEYKKWEEINVMMIERDDKCDNIFTWPYKIEINKNKNIVWDIVNISNGLLGSCEEQKVYYITTATIL